MASRAMVRSNHKDAKLQEGIWQWKGFLMASLAMVCSNHKGREVTRRNLAVERLSNGITRDDLFESQRTRSYRKESVSGKAF